MLSRKPRVGVLGVRKLGKGTLHGAPKHSVELFPMYHILPDWRWLTPDPQAESGHRRLFFSPQVVYNLGIS